MHVVHRGLALGVRRKNLPVEELVFDALEWNFCLTNRG